MIGFVILLSVFGKVYNAASCGQTNFYSYSGFINSMQVKNGNCIYKIDVSISRRWILLTWSYFEFHATMPDCNDGDYVEVYTGCLWSSSSVSRFCTRNMKHLPHAIVAYDGCMEIHVRNVRGSASSSFSASYKTFSISEPVPPSFYSGCQSSAYVRSQVGVISSYKWPLFLDPNVHYNCEWDTYAGARNKVIKLNFMDMDIGSRCSWSKVIVQGKNSVVTSKKEKFHYCRKGPFSQTTSYYELEIDFEGYVFFANRGFVVGYVAYDDGRPNAVASWKFIVGGAIASLFVIAFVAICCYCSYKRRQAVFTEASEQYTGVQYGAVPSGPLDSYPKAQLVDKYPQQPSYPQQYPGYPQQAAYPTPAEFPVKQGYPRAEVGIYPSAPFYPIPD